MLNAKPPEGAYVAIPAELVVLPGVPEALGALRGAMPGLRIAIVTNQRGVALGRMTGATVDAIHARLRAELAAAGGDVDRIEVCPHERDACDCRKPGIGLFRRALAAWPDVDPARMRVRRRLRVRPGGRAALSARAPISWAMPARRLAEGGVARAQGAAPDEEADSLPELVADGRLSRGSGTARWSARFAAARGRAA